MTKRQQALLNELETLPKGYISRKVIRGRETFCHQWMENGCKSLAFPCISTGIYGYPKEEAAKLAVREVENFLTQRSREAEVSDEMEVSFCCFAARDAVVYEEIFNQK